jgi:type III restriction enzyme
VEIKGIHGEDAKDKRSTIETHWLPGVNRLGTYGRWAFLELTDPFAMEKEFGDWIEARVKG